MSSAGPNILSLNNIEVIYDRVALAIRESDRLDSLEGVQRPRQAGCRILAGREQDEGGRHCALIPSESRRDFLSDP